MTRRRQPPPPEPATIPDNMPAAMPWRDFVPAGTDLAQLARDLAAATRWSIAQTDRATAPPTPQRTADAATDLDALDAWLIGIDATVEATYRGRRRSCWECCLGRSYD